MNILSAIPDTMLAINCLDENEKEVHGHVKRLWGERFLPHNSFWLDVCQSGDQNLVRMLKEQQAKADLPPNPDKEAKYQISVFMDLREQLEQNVLEQIEMFYRDFNPEFGSDIRSIMIYCYVGSYNGCNHVPNIRENIQTLIQEFPDARLCQIGENSPGERDGECWIPAMAFIDVMRRYPTLLVDHLVTLRVGYFQYQFYKKALRKQKERELNQYEELLREGDESCIEAYLMELLSSLDNRVKSEYDLNGEVHPIHPDLQPARGLAAWWSRLWKKADKEKAIESTRYAVEQTGKRLMEEIDAVYQLPRDKADEILKELIARTGVKALSNGTFKRILEAAHGENVKEPMLRLSEGSDIAETIQMYLDDCCMKARVTGHKSYRERICEAYNRYAQNTNFDELWKTTKEKHTTTAEHLKRLPDFSAFCSNCVERADGLIGYVRMDGRGESVDVCLYEGADEAEANALDKACGKGSDLSRKVHSFRLVGDLGNNEDVPAMMIRLALFIVEQDQAEGEV